MGRIGSVPSVATLRASTWSTEWWPMHFWARTLAPPWAEIPIAAVIGARAELTWAELRVAIFKIRCQHLHGSARNDFKVTEEAHLDIGAILVVEPMWRISRLCAQRSPQTVRLEDGIGVNLNGIVCRLPLADLANLKPDLVKDRPMYPSTGILALQLVELVVGVFHLMVTYPFVLMGADTSL